MKIDFHFHLEEGPYSPGWLKRTAEAIVRTETTQDSLALPNSLEWLQSVHERMNRRLLDGCFAPWWIERYLEVGRQRGIERFGLVDHLYRFKEFKKYYERFIRLDDSLIGKLQRQWLDQVCAYSFDEYMSSARSMAEENDRLHIGIEADYFPNGEAELRHLLEPYPLDFVIGSVHFIDGWGFDNPATRHIFEEYDLADLYTRYFSLLNRAVSSGLFDIIGHPDNIKVFGYRPDEDLLIPHYRNFAGNMKRRDMATEINTGLSYRYPVKEMCPSPAFLKILAEHGVPVSLSSDAHFPDDIGTMSDDALSLAAKCGYEELVYFKNRKRHALKL